MRRVATPAFSKYALDYQALTATCAAQVGVAIRTATNVANRATLTTGFAIATPMDAANAGAARVRLRVGGVRLGNCIRLF